MAGLVRDEAFWAGGAEAPAPPGEVTILNSAAVDNGGSFTAGAGSFRAVVFAAGARNNSTDAGTGIDSVTFGGVAMTQGHLLLAASGRIAAIWYLLEAGIPSGSQTMTVSWSVTPVANFRGQMYTLEGVNQSDPIGDVGDDFNTTSQTVILQPSSALDCIEGDMVITSICNRNDKTSTLAPSTGYDTDLMVFSDSHTRAAAHRVITATGSHTPSWNHTEISGSEHHAVAVWAVFEAA